MSSRVPVQGHVAGDVIPFFSFCLVLSMCMWLRRDAIQIPLPGLAIHYVDNITDKQTQRGG